jgi:hypothetical protein
MILSPSSIGPLDGIAEADGFHASNEKISAKPQIEEFPWTSNSKIAWSRETAISSPKR